jgi:hypothetical protein
MAHAPKQSEEVKVEEGDLDFANRKSQPRQR